MKPDLDVTPSPAASRPGFAVSWKRVATAFLPIAAFGVILLLDVPLCPMRVVFGVPCPGCGLTRATLAMGHLDFGAMLRFHPLAPLLTPMYIYAVVRAALVFSGIVSTERKDLFAIAPKWVWPIALVAILGVWIARMAGLLGGLPDPLDPANGLIGTGLQALAHAFR